MKLKYNKYLLITALYFLGVESLGYAQQKEKKAAKAMEVVPDSLSDKDLRFIGYGMQDSVIISSAISTIKGEALLKNFNTNTANKLYGLLPGITVNQGGNESGFNSPSISGRGVGTYKGNSTSPLIMVDGFLGSFENIVPEEIEEISFLKDASATAIYGFRGANGVLLITTKRGKKGPLKVSFGSQYGFAQATRLPETLNAFQYANLYNEAAINDGGIALYGPNDLLAYRDGTNPVLFPNVNFYDQIIRNSAPVSNINLNFRGGSNDVKYFLSLNSVSNQGLLKNFGDGNPTSSNSTYNRYNFRSNIEVKVNKRFTATLLLGGNLEDKFNPNQISAGSIFNSLASIPANAFPVFIPNGSVEATGTPIPNGSYASGATIGNPLANVGNTGFVQYTGRTIQSAFSLKHDLDFVTKGLSVSGAVSFNNFFQGGSIKSKQVQTYRVTNNNGVPLYTRAIPDPNTSLTGSEIITGQNRNFAYQGFLNYNRTFGKHDISAMAFFNSDNYNIDRPQPTTSGPNNAFPYKTNGGGGRLTYVNSNKYIAEFSMGVMGSENFAKDKRYGYFPAGSIGWIASNESFLNGNKNLTFLKLRASYGLAGNDDIGGRFLFEQRYPNGASYVFGPNTSAFSLIEGRLANPNITWEKDKKANIGFDATFFNNLSLSVDLFNNNRYDILPISDGGGNVPSFLGFNQLPLLNLGKVKNQGFEASLGYNSEGKNKNFSFYVQGNVFYAKNKILVAGESIQLNQAQYRTGNAIDTPFGLVALGLFQSQAEINASPKPIGSVIKIGDIKYADIGGPLGVPDGIIDENDTKALGYGGSPNLTAGLRTGLKFKGFDLDMVFQGVTQKSVFLGGDYFRPFQNNNNSASAIAYLRFTPETATTAEFPRLSLNGNQNNYRFSSFYQRDGSFIKLRSAEIGYSFSNKLVSKIRLNSARLFINGTNLFSLDHIKYGDPEALGTGYPPMRTLSLGVKTVF